MKRTMKLFTTSVGFVMVFAFAGNAAADTPVKLQLSIQPAANDAELDKLMRQNTVRVALQRHRLWQQAADREIDREKKQLGDETQTREQKKVRTKSRKRTKTATPAAVPKTGDDVAIDGDEGASNGDGTQAREQHRYQNQERTGAQGDKGKAAGVADRTRLRNMLREERVSGSDDALEEKLQQRLREHKRQTDRAKSGQKKQHKKGGGSGSGKRSGR